jgi:hypothetical protein
MKGTRHSEEQIIAMLKQGEAGLTTAELCRAVQPSRTTSATVEAFSAPYRHSRTRWWLMANYFYFATSRAAETDVECQPFRIRKEIQH